MRCDNRLALVAALALVACTSPPPRPPADGSVGDGLGGFDLAEPDLAPAPDGAVAISLADNVATITIDSGPAAGNGNAFNVPFISITLCAPGSTTNCQTIDHITVDTGSIGLHVFANVIKPGLLSALTPTTDASSHQVAECYTYASGYVFGTVRSADLTISGEHASNVAFMAIADPAVSMVPNACSNGQQGISTVAEFGANGIIGVGLFAPDCGSGCTTAGGTNPSYYSCSSPTSCTAAGLAAGKQLQNPVSLFPADNNGVIIDLPAINDTGAMNPTGTLTFGIGTQTNNKIGSATIIKASVFPAGGDTGLAVFNTNFGGEDYADSVFDSGTAGIAFTNSTVPSCTGTFAGLFCPTGTQSYSATLTDASSAQTMLSFKLATPDVGGLNLEASTDTAFDDIGFNLIMPPLFIWGLPVFYGHRLFFAIDGASTPSGNGPYYGF